MVDRAQGRKKSQFTQQSTVLANSYMDYFVNGTNYKIAYTDFVGGLGVTGTIVQEGAVTGTPVLDVDGTINNIRNLEDGAGILTSVSPNNGITIAHNISYDTTGAPLFLNTTATSPVLTATPRKLARATH